MPGGIFREIPGPDPRGTTAKQWLVRILAMDPRELVAGKGFGAPVMPDGAAGVLDRQAPPPIPEEFLNAFRPQTDSGVALDDEKEGFAADHADLANEVDDLRPFEDGPEATARSNHNAASGALADGVDGTAHVNRVRPRATKTKGCKPQPDYDPIGTHPDVKKPAPVPLPGSGDLRYVVKYKGPDAVCQAARDAGRALLAASWRNRKHFVETGAKLYSIIGLDGVEKVAYTDGITQHYQGKVDLGRIHLPTGANYLGDVHTHLVLSKNWTMTCEPRPSRGDVPKKGKRNFVIAGRPPGVFREIIRSQPESYYKKRC